MKLTELSLFECKEAINSREITSEELTRAYVDAIREKDGKIHAFLDFKGETPLSSAKSVDNARVCRNFSPLFGIPYALKDNISTRGIRTTAASRMLGDYIPPYSATVVERLAFSPILGKTNMDEFGMGSTTETSAFFATKNPLDTTRSPGGSSGGSAAAVAAGMAPFALGSDTGGSVRQPAAFCGIVGMKPTYGLVSRYGLISFASSPDCIGPMTRSVSENALVLSAIAGRDDKDASSADSEANYLEEIESGVKGMKIAILRDIPDSLSSSSLTDKMLSAAKKLESEGAFVEEISLSLLEEALAAYYIISSAEASSNLGRYDGVRYGHRAEKFSSVEELYRVSRSEGFGDEVKRRIMLGAFVLSEGYYDKYYARATQIRNKLINVFNSLFAEYSAILTLTSPVLPPKLGEKRTPTELYAEDVLTVPASLAGLPALSLPGEKTEDGFPVGLQLIGQKFSEGTLYRIARVLEEVTE